jgi:hypothetical protein
MPTSHGLPLLLALLAATACKAAQRDPHGDAPSDSAQAPSAVASAAPAPPSSAADAPACEHRRPFADGDKPLVLPAPFADFTPCDLLKAFLGHEPAPADRARVDRVRRWDVHGRALLAALYYRNEDAAGRALCDTCRVTPHLGIVERRGAALALVGRMSDPWHPAADDRAPFHGRADFVAELPFDATEAMLAVETPWSAGASGDARTVLSLYRLVDDEAKMVFEESVRAVVADKGAGDEDEVVFSVTTAPRPDGANDILLKPTQKHCHFDYGSFDPKPMCGRPKTLQEDRGKDRAGTVAAAAGGASQALSGRDAHPARRGPAYHRAMRVLHVLAGGLLFSWVGCGGSVVTPKGGTGGVGTGPGTGGGTTGLCPASEPTPGTACSLPAGSLCTYGDSVRPDCRTEVTCGNGGTWMASHTACKMTPAGDCPAAEPAKQTVCANDGDVCTYGNDICLCNACSLGPCMAPPPKWTCSPPPGDGCPAVAPNSGTSCTQENLMCSYVRLSNTFHPKFADTRVA